MCALSTANASTSFDKSATSCSPVLSRSTQLSHRRGRLSHKNVQVRASSILQNNLHSRFLAGYVVWAAPDYYQVHTRLNEHHKNHHHSPVQSPPPQPIIVQFIQLRFWIERREITNNFIFWLIFEGKSHKPFRCQLWCPAGHLLQRYLLLTAECYYSGATTELA